jgi:hypothetical protein
MALDGASSGDASAPPSPTAPPPPSSTRDRREREPRATSWRTRRPSRRSGRANDPRDLRRKCLRHREAQREAWRRRALLLSGALRFPSGQPKHGEPMLNTASFLGGGALAVRGARGRGLRGEARAKNTIRVRYSYTYVCFQSERPNPRSDSPEFPL